MWMKTNRELEKIKTELEMHKMVLRLLVDRGYLNTSMSSPLYSNTNQYFLNNEPINKVTYKLINKIKSNLYK